MKSFLSLFIVVTLLTIVSCQKQLTPPNILPDPPSPADSIVTQKSIKVWHGVRTVGVAPKPAGIASAPVIEPPEGDFIYAFAGRYAIIKPTVTSGNVTGYYVSINGASDFFKVDYTKPAITERKYGTDRSLKRANVFGLRTDSAGNPGYIDSAIVLILPPDIKTPDTICVTYSAYDEFGNISEVVSSCIIVSKMGGDVSTDWLQGGWRINYFYENYNLPVYDTIQYKTWHEPQFYYEEYFCNTLSSGLTEVGICDNSYGPCEYLDRKGDSDYVVNKDIIFNNNGGFLFKDSAMLRRIDTAISTCSDFTYSVSPFRRVVSGGWTAVGDKIILIFEFDENGTPVYEAEQYILKKINDDEIWLMDAPDPMGGEYYKDFRKL